MSTLPTVLFNPMFCIYFINTHLHLQLHIFHIIAYLIASHKAWPHDRENHTKSCDYFGELSLCFDQPHTRLTKHIINSPRMSLARGTNSRKLPNREAW